MWNLTFELGLKWKSVKGLQGKLTKHHAYDCSLKSMIFFKLGYSVFTWLSDRPSSINTRIHCRREPNLKTNYNSTRRFLHPIVIIQRWGITWVHVQNHQNLGSRKYPYPLYGALCKIPKERGSQAKYLTSCATKGRYIASGALARYKPRKE